MIGSYRKRLSKCPISRAGRIVTVGLAGLVLVGLGRPAIAQSGRVREPKAVPPAAAPSAPKETAPLPTESPNSQLPAPIPPGGSIEAQSVDGALVRTELANGVVFVVRENPATPVACIATAVSMPEGLSASRALEIGRLAARSGVGSPAARVASLGGMIDVSVEGDILCFTTSVLGSDVDAVLSAHAGLFAAQSAPAESPALLAERTTVVVSGRANAYTALSTVQREFGAIRKAVPPTVVPPPGKRTGARPPPPAVAPPPPPAPVAAAPTSRYVVRQGAIGPANVTIAFDPPTLAAADRVVVDVLAAALGVGRTSRLSLAYGEAPFAFDVSAQTAWVGSRRGLSISIAADAARVDDASAIVWRELDRLRRERLSDAELQRAVNQAELANILRRSRADDDAIDLVRLELGSRDVTADSKLRGRIRAVTSAEVQSVAARMFTLAGASIVESMPPGGMARPATFEAYASRVNVWAPGIQREVAAGEIRDRPSMPRAPEGDERGKSGERADSVLVPVPLPVRDFSTLNGPKAFVREDASQPVVAFGCFFPSGRAAESPANRGITELMLRSMLRGSKRYPGDALLFAIERSGGTVRIVNEPDFFGVVVEVLSRNAELVVPVLIDMVESPQFETVAVLGERERLLADQRPSRVPPSVGAVDLFWQGRYPTHSYGVAAEGLPETVAKQTDESVRAWYAKSVQALYPLVGIVGDTDGSSLVSRFVVDGFDRPEGERLASPVVPAPSTISEVATVVPSATTVAVTGAVTPGGNWDALEAIEIALRSVQLRVAALPEPSAVLGVTCGLERRRQAGAALCTVVSLAESEAAARSAVVAELGRVAGASWSAEEIAAGRRCAIVSWVLATGRCADMMVAYVRSSAFGLPLDTVERYAERIDALPTDGVRRATAALLEPGRLVRGVVRGAPSR